MGVRLREGTAVSLRYALLAILRVGPQSGYELQKQFSVSAGLVWHAPDSQIYPELRKMANEGLIDAEDQARGERGMRRLYHVTAAGEQAFSAWMNSPLDYQRFRDPAHLRAAYLESALPESARTFLRGHITHWETELTRFQGELDHIAAMDSPMLNRRLAVTSDTDRERTIEYKRFTYEGLAERALGEIAWARRGLALVDRLEGEST